MRMQSKFGFVDQDGRWRVGLHKGRHETNETQRTIRQLTWPEDVVAVTLFPEKPEHFFTCRQFFRIENEIVEKRQCQTDDVSDLQVNVRKLDPR